MTKNVCANCADDFKYVLGYRISHVRFPWKYLHLSSLALGTPSDVGVLAALSLGEFLSVIEQIHECRLNTR